MKAGTEKRDPQIVFRGGKPSAVILDIDVYQEILERLDDIEDLKMLKKMRERPLNFRELDSFLKKFSADTGVKRIAEAPCHSS